MTSSNIVSRPSQVIGTGQCHFHDAASGRRCANRGIALLLKNDLDRYVLRVLCGEHSDWVQA